MVKEKGGGGGGGGPPCSMCVFVQQVIKLGRSKIGQADPNACHRQFPTITTSTCNSAPTPSFSLLLFTLMVYGI